MLELILKWRKTGGRRKIVQVFEVYEEIAHAFSSLRSKPWPIAKVVKDGVILDLGSGPCINGIYVTKQKGGYLICLDISFSMARISRRSMLREGILGDAIAADMLFLPFRNSSISSVLSIASIHHIPREHGVEVMKELRRIAKPFSTILITVWSWRQSRFITHIFKNVFLYLFGLIGSLRECLVPWRKKDRVYWRYYYLYSLDELISISKALKLKVLSKGYIGYLRNRSENIYIITAVIN